MNQNKVELSFRITLDSSHSASAPSKALLEITQLLVKYFDGETKASSCMSVIEYKAKKRYLNV